MKTIKKNGLGMAFVILSVIFLLCFFLAPVVPSQSGNYETDSSVSIANLSIHSKASIENKYDVTESFDVTINTYGLHEIVRFIPYAGYNYRSSGTNVDKKLYIARIQNASGYSNANTEFNLYADEQTGYLTFGLKSPTSFNRGSTIHCQISYTYDCGKDENKGFDDLYFNIVGTSSPMSITNVSFEVELPKVSAEKISVYYGKEGATSTLDYSYNDDTYVVSGTVDTLNPYEGITLRAVYKEGVLQAKPNFSVACMIAFCIALIVLAAALVYYFCFAQNRKLVVPVEVTVPEGLNPYLADFYVNGSCSSKNLISCLLVLANKGYVSFNKLEDGDLEIVSLKEPTLAEESVLKSVYNYFFSNKSKIKLSEFDAMSAVEMVEHAAQSTSICNSETVKGKNILYDKKPQKIKKTLNSVSMISFVAVALCVALASFFFFGFFSSVYTFKFLLIGAAILLLGITMLVNFQFIYKALVYAAVYAMIFGLYFMFGFANIDGFYLLIGTVLFLLPIAILVSVDSKYTQNGAVAKGRALGFEKYIRMCEVEQIKMFAEENPSYFFDVLPYAYSFGLTDVWIKKFETIPLEMPSWIVNNDGLTDLFVLSTILNDLNYKTSRVVNYTPKSSGGGGFNGGSFGGGSSFGGGGFSGGGSGGGGFGAR